MGKPMKTPRKVLGGDAPLYRVTAKSYINGVICGPGTGVENVRYEGIPGKALEPLNEAAKAAKDAVAKRKPVTAKGVE